MPVISKRLSGFLIALLVFTSISNALAGEIPTADNLAESGQVSRQQGIPLVLFVSRDACPYCRTLRSKILEPMFAANKFEGRAILLEVSLDREDDLTGFENTLVTMEAFAESYGATITPTLLFLDAEGEEVSKRLVGISNLEFYSHYLQTSINKAQAEINAGKASAK